MKVAIDRAGRIVVPKALRDQLGLEAGKHLEAEVEAGRLVIVPVSSPVVLVEEDGRLVATTAEAAALSQDGVLRAIDQSRDWPRRS